MKSSEIREAFLNYFAKHNHQIVSSSSLVPANDPTLLFTNAGMVQFKDTFLGMEARSYKRAASVQRCVRAGGKHNDLENVGYTARHHTFFEMLGNFSFGDYFKRDAIKYAWEFLTQILKLPVERLWVTVFEEDDEAADIWLKEIGVSPARFSRCGEKDNFWSMGDTGPCGPCTEIFYDHGPEIAGGPPGSAEADGDRYIEIWNLVFMQFNRDKAGKLHPLPKPSVDTGMGLERIAAVVQGVHSNYEIDSFQYLIKAIASYAQYEINLEHPSLKVIADHIRACSFLIADGVLPSNEGRGYVLRRIIRRAVRHGNKLGLPTPFFCKLITPLIEIMGDAYPELGAQKQLITRILEQEENQFARTLQQGLNLLQEQIKNLKGGLIPGDAAFKLYDTYGFPVDLTADIAREQGLQVDLQSFEQCMQQQREQSQSASQFQADYSGTVQLQEASTFHGYEENSLQSEVLALLVDGAKVEKLTTGMKAAVILNKTPFYAESGGQVGDRGQLLGNQSVFRVDDTQRIGQAIVHYGEVASGELAVNQHVTAQIDIARREAIRLNHTATHLLHAALKIIVGTHVQQKGSLVDAERARFDFSHFEALTQVELRQLEALVNDKIRANLPVVTELMDIEAAKEAGAIALFGEKYTDVVRVLTMGGFSKELCGGTHARQTGDIGLFKITSEYGIASGVRRIELVTGAHALAWINEQLDVLNDVADKLKATPATISEKLAQFLQEIRQKEKELERLQAKLVTQSSEALLAEVKTIGHINLLVKKLDNADNQTLRTTLDQLKSRLNQAVIVLFTAEQGKLNVIAGISKDILGQVPPATAFVRHLCGKGGGREDMAQGGGSLPADLDAKLARIPDLIAENTVN
ncbi:MULTISPECIES: alanine--tRNA ligase [Legionella]|uniref:alanine--tRNA ligase n=1 Tax=Legionella TaxID=445 RepID=UPI000F8F02AA|nr:MULTISPECIES: alanine--tRNA ligase [Legionella]MCP0914269.1 alanine--tRNA ligase [Legionella sp. 27cVA30]RUR11771.1 alanine--tRNA ligase [Legionella septentrionalis]